MKNKILFPKNTFTHRQGCFGFPCFCVWGSRWLSLVLTLCVVKSVFCFSASAALITWTNTSGGSWNAPVNWSPNTVPDAADDVFITSSGTYTVVMNVSPSISSLTLGGVSGVQTLTNASQILTISHASLVDAKGILGMNSGTISGVGELTVNGQLIWNGGTLSTGGTMSVATNGIMNFQAGITLLGSVNNQGTINWLGGTLTVDSNNFAGQTGTIANQSGALFDIQSDKTIISGGAHLATFHNAGLLRKRVTAGSSVFNVILDNSGLVQAKTGTLGFDDGSNLGGAFQADLGAAIKFTGGTYTLSNPPDFQGPGSVLITRGNVTLIGFTGTFTLSGPNLIGQSTIASSGIINLNGTSLDTGASLLVASNAVLNLQAAVTLLGSLNNQGTVNWLGGSLIVESNSDYGWTGTIVNQAGALFDIECDQTIISGGAQLATFHNAGLLRKRVTSGSTFFNLILDNTSGTVHGQSGTMMMYSSYTESTASRLAISLASNISGTGFGKIQFATTNSIAGKFILSTLGGYRPNPGDSFFVLGYPAVTGDFTSMEGLDLGNGLRLASRPSDSGLTLVAVSYPITALPNLTLNHSLTGILVGWPTNFTGWTLQRSTNFIAPSWSTLPVAGTNNTVVPITSSQQFFRLAQ